MCFLSDYFDLVAEAQPDVFEIHYDRIENSELYVAYKEDSFVTEIGRGKVV
jgi:hypothetical protein